MYTDIRRICEKPTDEDREWFPDLAGTPWLPTLRLRDAQLQGRELHRPVPVAEADARLPPVRDPRRRAAASELEVSAIHDEQRLSRRCARRCRASTTWASREPNIQVWNVNLRGDRSLTLRHTRAQQPAAARQRAGGAQARRAAVGLRRASRERRPVGRRDLTLVHRRLPRPPAPKRPLSERGGWEGAIRSRGNPGDLRATARRSCRGS